MGLSPTCLLLTPHLEEGKDGGDTTIGGREERRDESDTRTKELL